MEDFFTGVGGVHKSKTEFISGGADIFTSVPVEKATRYSRESTYRPTSENPDGPYDFYLPAEGDTYVDPDSFRLTGYTQFVKIGDGFKTEALTGEEDAAPINFVCGMAFKTKQLSINGQLVNYTTQPLDNVKAYWEHLLSYGTDLKNTVLKTAANWIPDEAGKADAFDGVGFKARKALWAKSKNIGFSIPLQLDVLTTDRFLPKNMDMQIKLHKADDYLLYTANDASEYKVVFHDLKLHARRITMTPELLRDHDARFNAKQLALFPFARTDIKTIQIGEGQTERHTNNIYRQRIPNSVIIFFVNSHAFSGAKSMSPINFQNFNITKVSCFCNSEEIYSYVQNYKTDDFTHTYRRVFDEIGIRTNNTGNNLTAEEFKDGCNFYPFDLSPDKCSGFHDHLDLAGNLDFRVQFGEPTEKAVTMVIMSTYDDRLVLDGSRNVVNRGEPVTIK